jgi:uncharacterized protein with PIN domain
LCYNAAMRFVVDCNVGKLARWLRVAGFDALFFKNIDDNRLVRVAVDEGRVLLTKDTDIMKRRLVTSGKLKAILIEDDEVKSQLSQVLAALDLGAEVRPFTRCIECNEVLEPRDREAVRDLVPPHVSRTQTNYMQCTSCRRVYWRGTHWEKMTRDLEEVTRGL